MEVSGQLHAPAAITPGKEPLLPLDRMLGGFQSPSGRCERKTLYIVMKGERLTSKLLLQNYVQICSENKCFQ
jgi:hypothetical protein